MKYPPQVVFVDSDDCEDKSHSDFWFDLKLQHPYNRVALLSAKIPRSFYVISENQNTFTLTEGGSSYTVSIPIGNYSYRTFKTALQTALNTAGSFTYTVLTTNILQLGHYNFSVSGNSGVQPIFEFPESELYKRVGFNWGIPCQFSADALESIYIINLSPLKAVSVRSSIVRSFSHIGRLNGKLADIIPNGGDYSDITWQTPDADKLSHPLQNVDGLAMVDIQITDLDSAVVELNGASVNLTLVFFDMEIGTPTAEDARPTQILNEINTIKKMMLGGKSSPDAIKSSTP